MEREQFLASLSGSHQSILEYLVTEVLNVQPEPIQEFLLETSILDRLSGSLCEAVTGWEDCSLLLDKVERADLFLQPLDGGGEWFRYHTLFAEAMRHKARCRFGEGYLRELYHNASLWYERQGFLVEAFEEQNQSVHSQPDNDRKPLYIPMVDPLSLQEERVLGMLVSRLSYQEIAQELVVSINTVKTHVKGVYRKLNVSKRSEAREVVRRLNLL